MIFFNMAVKSISIIKQLKLFVSATTTHCGNRKHIEKRGNPYHV